MQKDMVRVFLVILLSMLPGCFVVNVNLVPQAYPLEEQVIASGSKDKILLMDITGVITTEESSGLLGAGREPGMVALVREQLDHARSDKSVKAVVIRINSPGGGVTAADMLYHEIRKFRNETGAKVVAHFTDTGASGGYYAALAADRITAQPTSITGSIGVTMLRIDATGLLQKIGIRALEISSGPEKNMGSPFRPITSEEKKIFQNMINDLFERFVGIIVQERKMPPERARELADGRIYTGNQAKKAGLIDDVGYLDDAFALANTLANIARPTIITYRRPGEYRPNIYSLNINMPIGEMAGPGIRFAYLWMP